MNTKTLFFLISPAGVDFSFVDWMTLASTVCVTVSMVVFGSMSGIISF